MPKVELDDSDTGLIFVVTPAINSTPQAPQTNKPSSSAPQEKPSNQGQEPIELTVTGEQDGYTVPDATTATRTDAPLRDIPQSIQVIPREVIEDRNVTRMSGTSW